MLGILKLLLPSLFLAAFVLAEPASLWDLTSLICGIDLAECPSPFFLPAELASHSFPFSGSPAALTAAAAAA
jgi:hypothetical protein